jgi:hypothetical protein
MTNKSSSGDRWRLGRQWKVLFFKTKSRAASAPSSSLTSNAGVGHLAGFKRVAENQCENGQQDQEQNQDAPVPIDMKELFVSHARDRAERTIFHGFKAGFKASSYPCRLQ